MSKARNTQNNILSWSTKTKLEVCIPRYQDLLKQEELRQCGTLCRMTNAWNRIEKLETFHNIYTYL